MLKILFYNRHGQRMMTFSVLFLITDKQQEAECYAHVVIYCTYYKIRKSNDDTAGSINWEV